MGVVNQGYVESFLSKSVQWSDEAQTLLAYFGQKKGIDPDEVAKDSAGFAKLIPEIMSWHYEEDAETGKIVTQYCPEEIASIQAFEMKLWGEVSDLATGGLEEPLFIMSAGSPGAGKTTLLEEEIKKRFRSVPSYYGGIIYIDPDEPVLMQMPQYKRSLQRALKAVERGASPELNEMLEKYGVSDDLFAKFVAYTKWRWASNYISNSFMNRAAEGRYNIAHGTTATSLGARSLLDNVADQGYKVEVLMVDADMELKQASNQIRMDLPNGKYVPDYDVVNKAAALKDNIPYLFNLAARTGGKIDLFWRDGNMRPSCVGSWWTKPGKHGPLINVNTASQAFLGRYGYDVTRANAEFQRCHRDVASSPSPNPPQL
tara:strand:+ start:469 stop:1584 length:1116 start_codon:yes stop_codon:yes gene_type:complete